MREGQVFNGAAQQRARYVAAPMAAAGLGAVLVSALGLRWFAARTVGPLYGPGGSPSLGRLAIYAAVAATVWMLPVLVAFVVTDGSLRAAAIAGVLALTAAALVTVYAAGSARDGLQRGRMSFAAFMAADLSGRSLHVASVELDARLDVPSGRYFVAQAAAGQIALTPVYGYTDGPARLVARSALVSQVISDKASCVATDLLSC